MRIVIAPDKFKGSLSAPDVARHLETGLQAAAGIAGQGNLEVLRIPVADGGEGTLDAAVGSGFTRRSAVVSGPTGQPIEADFAVRGREAVIEMAAASGLAVLPGRCPAAAAAGFRQRQGRHEPGHRRTDPRRPGRRLPADHPGRRRQRQHRRRRRGPAGPRRQAPRRRRQRTPARRCRPGATCDASTSPASTPAWRRPASSWPATSTTPCWVPKAPLRSSARRRAPPRRTWQHWTPPWPTSSDVLAAEIGPRALKAADAPGAGAAGGVGYAAIAALAATRRPGIDVVLEFTELADRLAGADLVITGEGSLDEQSLLGKTPMGVARAAAARRRAGGRRLRPHHADRRNSSRNPASGRSTH